MSLFGGDDQELRITLQAKDEASADIAKVNASVGNLAKGFAIGTIAVDALRTGFRFLSGVVTDLMREFEQQSLAIGQMNAVLNSTHFAAGLTASELVQMSKALSDNTLYTDNQVLSAQNLLLTFTNVTKDTFPRATEAIINMSTALGQDLLSSTEQLGKALNNPIDGLAMLSRVGIQFTGTQTDMITSLVKSGQQIKAEGLILDEIEKKFAGSAQSAYEAASSTTKLEKDAKELEQAIGSGLTPAFNNLLDSVKNNTSGMGSYDDAAYAAFTVTSKLGEVLAAAAVGFGAIGTAIIATTTGVLQFTSDITGLSGVMKALGFDVDQNLSDWRNWAYEGTTGAVSFYDTLHDSNEHVLSSWGELNLAAGTVAKSGPAAYEATAQEAKAAADQIKKTEQAIADTKKTLDDYRKDLQGETTNIAELFVQQEQKVKDIQTQLRDEQNKRPADQDPRTIAELKTQLQKEYTAYTNARGIETQLPDQVAAARTRANETDFERSLGDAEQSIASKEASFAQAITYNINFNDAVAGDAGIRDIIARTIAEINRASALRSAGGI